MQSDAELAVLAETQALKELHLEKADEEMASALFGDNDASAATKKKKGKGKTQKVKLVKSSPHPDGTVRGLWKGTYGGGSETEVLKEPPPQPPSLLD